MTDAAIDAMIDEGITKERHKIPRQPLYEQAQHHDAYANQKLFRTNFTVKAKRLIDNTFNTVSIAKVVFLCKYFKTASVQSFKTAIISSILLNNRRFILILYFSEKK